MIEIKTGQLLELPYPFYDQSNFPWDGVITPGCHKTTEDDGSGYGFDIYWTANSEGKIVFEVLSIAEMPGKYMDRVIVKKHYIKPCGEALNRGEVIMMTIGKLNGHVTRNCVFPWEYKVEASYKPVESPKSYKF